MCELTRRSLLRWAAGSTAAAAAATLAGCTTPAGNPQPDHRGSATGFAVKQGAATNVPAGTTVTLLGTGGGPVYWPGGRKGISSALDVGGSRYLVDLGQGFAEQLLQAGSNVPVARLFGSLRAVFVTHLHLDHIADLAQLLTWAASNGVRPEAPVTIVGPQTSGEEPGMTGTVNLINRAFGASIAQRGAAPAPWELFRVLDMTLPAAAQGGTRTETLHPWPVYADENISVSTIPVKHGTMRPAHAFRFETADGSITFSGDTAPCENLNRLALGSNLLIHEAFDPQAMLPYMGRNIRAVNNVAQAHTRLTDIAAIGNACEVGHLVLSHLGPGVPGIDWAAGGVGYRGNLTPGQDLMRIRLQSGTVLPAESVGAAGSSTG